MENIKDLAPYILGVAGTVIALKKDWIKSQFTREEAKLNIVLTEEGNEAAGLANVEKTMDIYHTMVADLKSTISELKSELVELKQEVRDLKSFIAEQKVFIKRQSSSLDYYEKKYGKIKE